MFVFLHNSFHFIGLEITYFVSLSPPPQNCFALVSCDVMAWYFSSATHFLSYQFSFIYLLHFI